MNSIIESDPVLVSRADLEEIVEVFAHEAPECPSDLAAGRLRAQLDAAEVSGDPVDDADSAVIELGDELKELREDWLQAGSAPREVQREHQHSVAVALWTLAECAREHEDDGERLHQWLTSRADAVAKSPILESREQS